jgi:hypothetical protein
MSRQLDSPECAGIDGAAHRVVAEADKVGRLRNA